MLNNVTFQCNLVKSEGLKYSQNGNAYLNLSVAKNYSVKEGDNWKNLDPIYMRLSLFGKTAELFEQSNIPNGSPLIVVANVSGRMRPSFTTKAGIQVPEAVEEQYYVEAIGPMIGMGRSCNVVFNKSNNNQNAQQQAPIEQPNPYQQQGQVQQQNIYQQPQQGQYPQQSQQVQQQQNIYQQQPQQPQNAFENAFPQSTNNDNVPDSFEDIFK